jgi:photosystem II stability/assembly factor-like uncharacterized protein
MKYMKIITTLVFSLLACGYLPAQQSPWDIWMNPGTDDFATIRQNAENYFANIDISQRGSGYKQYKRWEYMHRHRLTDDGKLSNYAARNFDEYHAWLSVQGPRDSRVTYGEWSSLGPTSWTDGNGWNGGLGRVNCIAFHPYNSGIFWIGCPAGGLWKTTNGGNSWVPLTDGMPIIGVSGIAIDYTNPDIIYILTGDGDAADTYSIGVLKTTDGGVTWSSTPLSWPVTYESKGYKLLMHPTDPSILFVVSDLAIYRTANGGATWSGVHNSAGANYHDIEFKPGNPTIMYACAGSKFYRSDNTGQTWTRITEGLPTNASRMAIGVTPANSSYVYVFAGPSYDTSTYVGTYRSTDSGLNFTVRSTSPNIVGSSATGDDMKNQTWYDHAIAVSTMNEQYILTGGINCWKSSDGGINWTLSSMWDHPPGPTYTHADIHALEFNPFSNYLYCGSDGGIFRSTDFGDTWSDLSDGLAITQTYRLAGYQPDPDLLTNGTQDNGSNKYTGTSNFLHILGADGMDCMIDHSNSNIFYNCSQDGWLEKSTDGGNTYTSIKPTGSTGSWVTPFVMHPTNSQVIYGGYDDIYKTTDGGSNWTNLGYEGSGAMAIGTNDPDRIYASEDGNRIIYMSSNGGYSFTNVTNNLPFGTVTFISVNPDNAQEVYVTYGGYNADNKVFRSYDAGGNWTNITESLPNIPVNCIVFQDTDGSPGGAVYIGTDVGVYYRNNIIGGWIPFMNGLPAVIVKDLEINYSSGVITAGTFGRGLWRSELYSECPRGLDLTQANDPGNPNYTGFQHYEVSSILTSTRIITGGIGTDVTYQAGSYIVLYPGFHARSGNKFHASLGPCSGTGYASPVKPAITLTGTFVGRRLE